MGNKRRRSKMGLCKEMLRSHPVYMDRNITSHKHLLLVLLLGPHNNTLASGLNLYSRHRLQHPRIVSRVLLRLQFKKARIKAHARNPSIGILHSHRHHLGRLDGLSRPILDRTLHRIQTLHSLPAHINSAWRPLALASSHSHQYWQVRIIVGCLHLSVKSHRLPKPPSGPNLCTPGSKARLSVRELGSPPLRATLIASWPRLPRATGSQ